MLSKKITCGVCGCGAHLDNGETCDCQRDAGESNSDEERSANNDRN